MRGREATATLSMSDTIHETSTRRVTRSQTATRSDIYHIYTATLVGLFWLAWFGLSNLVDMVWLTWFDFVDMIWFG